MVRANLIPNWPVATKDISVAHKILVPEIGSIRGETVRRKPTVVDTEYIEIPPEINTTLGKVEIFADLMFVNSIPSMITLVKRVKFTTVLNLSNRKAPTLLANLKVVRNVYKHRGSAVSTMFMDNEFEVLDNALKEINLNLNTAAVKEHVPEIERMICVVKEYARSYWNTLPFQTIPDVMIVELIHYVVMWLNAFLLKSVISKTIYPRTIMTDTTLDYRKHCKIEFGAYEEAHEDPTPTNNMHTRAEPSICFEPVGNLQGSYK